MHIENIHWIVIEDGIKTSDPVNRLLKRSNIPYAYFFASKQPNLSRLVGGAVVEGPFVEAGKVISWHAHYKPNRTFAIDMAGFGVSLNLIHSTNASFGYQCINEAPEDCFLIQLGIKVNAIEPFGYKNSYMDVLVWHTNTVKSIILSKNNNGLEVEIED
uniref:Galactosylgalactosylxylosylprotein 3-beta-glucuronosyltransferase n=1 Tax=Panagrolaimus superbus TaxID=310955 RepID=A0A914Z097_9BILA